MKIEMWLRAATAFVLSATLAACGDESTPSNETATVKADQFCTMAGLKSPPRTTVVLIDASTIATSAPEKFRETNPALFALVMGLGDPERSVATGAVAPRERVTVLIGDPASGTVKPIFSGCVPGLSQTELEGRAAGGEDGAISKYFGSDAASKLGKSRDDFRKSLLVALVGAKTSGRMAATDSIEASPLARLIRAVGAGSTEDGQSVRRLFFFTDVGRSIPQTFTNYKESREAGFTAAEHVGANLGRSELYLVPASSPISDIDGAFLSAFFLGSAADLKRTSGFSADGLSPPPARIYNYVGELPLSPEVRSPLQLRLAVTPTGELVNSWISYSASKGDRATPLTGHFDCTDDDRCVLRGDPNDGLGQRWRTEPGNAPQPLLGGPFGGLRNIQGEDRGGRLTGRIFDSVIFVGKDGDLKFEAKRVMDRKGAQQ